jgi:uncharacterized protein YuzE
MSAGKLRLTYDEEFDVLYGGYEGSGPGAGAEEPAASLVIERDRHGRVTGFVLLDARRRLPDPDLQRHLTRAGFPQAPLRDFLAGLNPSPTQGRSA